jgi:hypothetical protein
MNQIIDRGLLLWITVVPLTLLVLAVMMKAIKSIAVRGFSIAADELLNFGSRVTCSKTA